LFVVFVASLSVGLGVAQAAVEVKELPGKIRVEIDGELLTEYCFTGAPHVYFHPLFGPDGAKMTRSYPMEDVAGEERDHPHHRGLWFAHGAVNGVDFWMEKPTSGRIEHEKFLELKSGDKEGVIRSQNRWVAPDGSVPVLGVQTFRAHQGAGGERIIDFEMMLTAGAKDVLFGDTKEGTMAIRVNESMRLQKPGKQPGQGQIVTSSGDRDGKAWGKRAAWVDYSGPVDGKMVGIGFFDHPKNPRHPTRWHARDYGLFAANPFAEHEMDQSQPKGAGDLKLPAGESVTFRYRIVLHRGNVAEAKVAEQFNSYAAGAQ
jgi:hypothetical protein